VQPAHAARTADTATNGPRGPKIPTFPQRREKGAGGTPGFHEQEREIGRTEIWCDRVPVPRMSTGAFGQPASSLDLSPSVQVWRQRSGNGAKEIAAAGRRGMRRIFAGGPAGAARSERCGRRIFYARAGADGSLIPLGEVRATRTFLLPRRYLTIWCKGLYGELPVVAKVTGAAEHLEAEQ
jgi:hypothetical protein